MPMLDIELLSKMLKGVRAVDAPVRRINEIDLRIYQISKLLPDKEGRELIRLHDEAKQKAIEVCTVYRRTVDEEE